MKRYRVDWFEMLVVAIVTIGVLVMTACLYLDILLMQRMNKFMDSVETMVVEVPDVFIEPETIEEQVEEVMPAVEYFDVPLDEDLQDHIFAECERYDVEPSVVIAMIERESRYEASVVGDNGRSFGLMQIQPKWHSARMTKLGCDDLLDPFQNVTVGIDFMAELLERGRGIEWALMAYNGGPGYADRLAGDGRVSDYAKGVLARSVTYELVV